MIVGITGGYCSGKDTAARIFEENGFSLVDVDRIGHRALEAKKTEIAGAFGSQVISGGSVDRRKLGGIVFGDPDKKKELERIVHPWMVRRVRGQVLQPGNWAINAALLVEMCLHVLCDRVVAVDTDRETALRRAAERDGVSPAQAAVRLDAQTPVKEKLHLVDIVIENNGSKESFRANVNRLVRSLIAEDRTTYRHPEKPQSPET
jgi:dephospho-CoA kinase